MTESERDSEAQPILSTASLERLLKHGSVREAVEGEILVRHGDPMDKFLVVLEGAIGVE